VKVELTFSIVSEISENMAEPDSPNPKRQSTRVSATGGIGDSRAVLSFFSCYDFPFVDLNFHCVDDEIVVWIFSVSKFETSFEPKF
jgi:hypothetical protein